MRRAAMLIALAATAGAAAPAQAATVSAKGVRFEQVAINADGRTIVAWERRVRGSFAVEVRMGRSPGRLGRVRRIAARGQSPQVAIGADGTAAITWLEFERRGLRAMHGVVARPGRDFGRIKVLERRRGNLRQVGVAVQPSGRVTAVWQRYGNKLGYAVAEARRPFGRPRNLASTGPVSTGSVALDPRDGTVVVAFGWPLGRNPVTNQQAAVRTQADGQGFAPPTLLTPPGATNLTESHPLAVAGPAGAGVAITSRGDQPSLGLARRAPNGEWLPVERIATADYGADVFPLGLAATLPEGGSAVVAWAVTSYSGEAVRSSRVVTSLAAPGSAFAAPLDVETVSRRVPALSLASAGDDAFLATARPRGPVRVRTIEAAGLGTTRVLARRGDGDVTLAAAGGRVVAVYQVGDRVRLTALR